MSQIQSNIRLMEFLVHYVHISAAFENPATYDETCLRITYRDYFEVYVQQSEYESNRSKKSKNCMFTTYDDQPSDGNEVDYFTMQHLTHLY